jgi:hypothetical protein
VVYFNLCGGLAPPWTPLPTPVGWGFAWVFGPTRGGFANVGYSPLLLVLWGDTPHSPRHGGFAPLDPLAHPRRLRVRQRFGSHSWRGCRGWQLAPSLGFWGHIPQTPCQGVSPPGPPVLPTPVSLGFADVLGPTRGGFANVGDSFPLLSLWGDTPTAPRHGVFAPLAPRFGPTRGEFVLYLKQGMESGGTFRFLQDYTAKLEVVPD